MWIARASHDQAVLGARVGKEEHPACTTHAGMQTRYHATHLLNSAAERPGAAETATCPPCDLLRSAGSGSRMRIAGSPTQPETECRPTSSRASHRGRRSATGAVCI